MKAKLGLPLGPTGDKINVAVQRPTVNVKESENLGEEAKAAARHSGEGLRFAKHGTFGPPAKQGIDSLWKD